MSDINMTTEVRTDYDCEAQGLPAERWAEAVFKLDGEEVIFEMSVEKTGVVLGILAGETAWKGTLKGFKEILEKNK